MYSSALLIALVAALPPTVQKPATAGKPVPVETGWRISPEKINVDVGEPRVLQTLDDSAQELEGASWSVDNGGLAELEAVADGRVLVHPKAPGTVRVTAVIGGEQRVRDITIWAAGTMPEGTTQWGVHPIGRELGDIPAVPIDHAPHMYSLEQTPSGAAYLRAGAEDGIQIWTWAVPTHGEEIELVCGDWLGGAVISANRADGYTLYAVNKDGSERWRYEATGLRKGLAISTEHLVHLLSRSPDGTAATLTGLDEASGATVFQHALPPSTERYVNLRRQGTGFACAADDTWRPAAIDISRLFVNMDGYAYVAFAQRATTFHTVGCTPGARLDTRDIAITRNERLAVWQIQPDGSYHDYAVETLDAEQPGTSPIATLSPTGAIIPDGLRGVLLSVRTSRRANLTGTSTTDAESVYRIDADGKRVYSFALPTYAGALHDGMVLGEREQAFATRGSRLSVFNVRTGEPMWAWDSQTADIEVLAALANGGIAIQTPTAVVEVHDGGAAREMAKGRVVIDWLGHMYVKR